MNGGSCHVPGGARGHASADEPRSPRYRLVLLRHAESEWNAQNLFAGWASVGLSAHGERAAGEASLLEAAQRHAWIRKDSQE